jgi:cation transporter-like permease
MALSPHNSFSHPPQAEKELSASVLGELKETIQAQAHEIQQLKAQLKAAGTITTKTSINPSTVTTTTAALAPIISVSHGGGHGAISTAGDEGQYLHKPFFKVSLQRVGWLGLFLTSLSMTALIMNIFEKTLEKHIELTYFVPLLAGHGGNTGGQTVGTVLSALSAGTIQPSHAPRIVLKEALAGIMSGVMLGSIVSPVAFRVLGVSFHVAVVLFFTLPLVSMVASTLGSLIPFVCVLLGLDPSVIAGPAMTSIVDVTGLMSYFLIANQIFKLYGLEL